MSVVESKREEGKLRILTKTRELSIYTIKICSNESHFPKRYRWCLTNDIVKSTLSINSFCLKANSIMVKDEDDFRLRKHYQTEALSELSSLLGLIDIAFNVFGIESSRVEYWTRLIMEIQTMIRNWRKRDVDRYTEQLSCSVYKGDN